MNPNHPTLDGHSTFVGENNANLDWTTFHSMSPSVIRNLFSPLNGSIQEDAVAPNDHTTLVSTPSEDGLPTAIDQFFSDFDPQSAAQPIQRSTETLFDPTHNHLNNVERTPKLEDPIQSTVSKQVEAREERSRSFSIEHIHL
jgi:hypothetical protein